MDLEDLRLTVYQHFAATGRAPTHAELAAGGDLELAQIAAGLRSLAADRHVVLDDTGKIVMAHPFSAIPLGFAVMGTATLWWGGCAWDSFALPHLLDSERDVLVSTRCPGCGEALAWIVDRERPPAGSEVAHFLIPAAAMWENVVRTCGNQRLFCSETCVQSWLERTGHSRGYVMDLKTLWRLARGWYAGRLERGYKRREPTQAAAYFRDVGLDGSFWGL